MSYYQRKKFAKKLVKGLETEEAARRNLGRVTENIDYDPQPKSSSRYLDEARKRQLKGLKYFIQHEMNEGNSPILKSFFEKLKEYEKRVSDMDMEEAIKEIVPQQRELLSQVEVVDKVIEKMQSLGLEVDAHKTSTFLEVYDESIIKDYNLESSSMFGSVSAEIEIASYESAQINGFRLIDYLSYRGFDDERKLYNPEQEQKLISEKEKLEKVIKRKEGFQKKFISTSRGEAKLEKLQEELRSVEYELKELEFRKVVENLTAEQKEAILEYRKEVSDCQSKLEEISREQNYINEISQGKNASSRESYERAIELMDKEGELSPEMLDNISEEIVKIEKQVIERPSSSSQSPHSGTEWFWDKMEELREVTPEDIAHEDKEVELTTTEISGVEKMFNKLREKEVERGVDR